MSDYVIVTSPAAELTGHLSWNRVDSDTIALLDRIKGLLPYVESSNGTALLDMASNLRTLASALEETGLSMAASEQSRRVDLEPYDARERDLSYLSRYSDAQLRAIKDLPKVTGRVIRDIDRVLENRAASGI